jgi:triosephosphate isomerase (TIM)
MRKKIVAGNWKMNKNLQEGIQLAQEIKSLVANKPKDVEVVVCTPFIHLSEVGKLVDTNFALGAENCASEAKGAFTGEVSAEMISSTGAKYVILGHSERRSYYHETSELLKKKVALALANGLLPIFCIGEVLEERESGKHFDVVKKQIVDGLFNLSTEEFAKVVVAYEPVWAIGTGKTASSAQAQEMHAHIRSTIAEKYGKNVAESTSILYGGSCNAANAKELFANNDVDGGLIGGASLKANDFFQIITSF